MVNLNRYRMEIFFLSVLSSIILLDQLTKWLVLRLHLKVDLNLVVIHLVKNTGAGFGILKEYIYLLTFISLTIALIMVLLYKKVPRQKLPQFLYALFLSGVVGNLIDRLFRKYVIDFIDFGFWPAFNIADMAISVAAVGLVIYFWKE